MESPPDARVQRLQWLAKRVGGMAVADSSANALLDRGDWTDYYPVALAGFYTGDIVKAGTAGYIVDDSGMAMVRDHRPK